MEHNPTDPRWLRTVLVCIGALCITAGFSRFSFAVAMPQMTDDVFGGSYSTAGIILAVNFGVYLLVVLLVRRYASRIDPTRLALAGLALGTVGLAVVAAAPTTPWVAAGSILLGIAAGGGFVPVTSIIAAVAPARRRGVAMGLGMAGVGISIVFSGQVMAALERSGADSPWRSMFVAEAVIGALVLVVALALWPRLPSTTTDAPRGSMHALPGRWALVVAYGLFGLGISTYTGFLVAAAREDRGLSSSRALLLSSIMGAAMAAALLVGRLSDAIGRRRTLVIAMATISICALVVPWGAMASLAVSAAVAGLFINGIGAVVGAYVGDHLDHADVTATLGVLTVAMASAQVAAPPLGGWLADRTGSFTAPFIAAATLTGLAAACALRLPPDQTGRSHQRRRGGAGSGRRLPFEVKNRSNSAR